MKPIKNRFIDAAFVSDFYWRLFVLTPTGVEKVGSPFNFNLFGGKRKKLKRAVFELEVITNQLTQKQVTIDQIKRLKAARFVFR